MVHVAENPNLETNRLRKAIRLANVLEASLRDQGCTVDELDLDAIDWEAARRLIHSRDLPSEKCKALAVSIIREREVVVGEPFQGLPRGRRA